MLDLDELEMELNCEDYARILEALKTQVKTLENEIKEEKDTIKQLIFLAKMRRLNTIKRKIRKIIE